LSYIGTPPSNAFTSLLKQDFSTSATTGYTLDHAVNNANDIALFINFVRQEPTAAYAASGTTLTLTSATASSDDMYCVYLGQALQTVNPPNASVGLSQLTATGTKDATTFLRGDNTFASAGGLSNAAYWYCNGDQTISAATATVITGSWVTATNNLQGGNELGTDLSQSSGLFSFPSTGIWYINGWVRLLRDGDSRYNNLVLQSTLDNGSNFGDESFGSGFIADVTGADATAGINVFAILDITNVSNQKIRLQLTPENQVVVNGNGSSSMTGLIAMRLGDT